MDCGTRRRGKRGGRKHRFVSTILAPHARARVSSESAGCVVECHHETESDMTVLVDVVAVPSMRLAFRVPTADLSTRLVQEAEVFMQLLREDAPAGMTVGSAVLEYHPSAGARVHGKDVQFHYDGGDCAVVAREIAFCVALATRRFLQGRQTDALR